MSRHSAATHIWKKQKTKQNKIKTNKQKEEIKQKTEALKTNGCYVIEIVVENFGSGEVFGKKKR